MAYLKEKHIEEAIEMVVNLSETELEELSELNGTSQINFLSYLLSAGIDFQNPELMELVVFYFNVFMEAAKNQKLDLKIVDDEMIELFEEDYFQVLDEYQETGDEEALEILCNQPMMLDFLLAEVHGEDEEGNVLDDEFKSQLFIIGMAMIGLFNRAIN